MLQVMVAGALPSPVRGIIDVAITNEFVKWAVGG